MPETAIDSTELESLIVAAIGRRGRAADAAVRLAARAIVEAERVGAPEFGLTILVPALAADTEWTPAPRSGEGLIAALDAQSRFAPLVVAEAALDAASAAEADGVGVVAVLAPTALGRIAPFARAIADRGLVGLIAAGSPPFVAPHGGTRPALGTNPIAVAVPTAGEAIVLDAASSALTRGRWMRLRDEGRALPPNVAVDAAGSPVIDPDDVAAFLPRGGLAGTALALVVEALTNGVAGIPGSSRQRRAVLVLALRSLEADDGVTATGDDLRERLAAGGGHVPGSGVPGHPGPVTVDEGLLAALRQAAG